MACNICGDPMRDHDAPWACAQPRSVAPLAPHLEGKPPKGPSIQRCVYCLGLIPARVDGRGGAPRRFCSRRCGQYDWRRRNR
jgi:hypothetical protein